MAEGMLEEGEIRPSASGVYLTHSSSALAHSQSKRNKVTHWPAPDKITVLALLESLLH
ncbi:hypothetical protein ACZ87_03877, partial [Candidatus Erwinia dacicola]